MPPSTAAVTAAFSVSDDGDRLGLSEESLRTELHQLDAPVRHVTFPSTFERRHARTAAAERQSLIVIVASHCACCSRVRLMYCVRGVSEQFSGPCVPPVVMLLKLYKATPPHIG